jgi:hypothetical protein
MIGLLASIVLAQTSDLTKVANWKFASKAIDFHPEHTAALKRNGFFVCPGPDEQLFNVLGENDYANLSSFITVDNVVQLYHVFFDSTLRTVEENHLSIAAKRMTSRLLTASIAEWKALSGTKLESAALKNVAYFGVADRLLGGNAAIPAEAAQLVAGETQAIDAHAGFSRSAIFPYDVDYSQFIVRGHYTKSKTLSAYFLGLMWYGLVPISLREKGGGLLPEQVRQAALMADLLAASGAQSDWNRIYSISSLFAGDANNLTPADWRTAARPVVGAPAARAKLESDVVLAKLVDAEDAASHPGIVSKRKKGVNGGDLQFRFMGQRSIPDSIVFNKLTGEDRPMPSPLDVGAVLGSRHALAIVDASSPQYAKTRMDLAAEWASEPASYWHQNLYNGTLDILRKTLQPIAAPAPKFMRSGPWGDKCLSTALCGWTELRHDTILYGEQTVAEMGDGDETQPFVKSYVEPNVPLYTRLLALVKEMDTGLARFGLIEGKTKANNRSEREQFTNFEKMLTFFISVAKREMNGGRLAKAEHMRLRKIEGDMSDLNDSIQLAGTNYQVLNADDNDMALIADVHTSYDTALEVAVGHADDLVAIVPIEGQNYIARGSALSFYTFVVPISERMTDHDWKALLEAGKDKARPGWTASYFVATPCRKQ